MGIVVSECGFGYRLDVLNDRTQEGLILELNMGNALRLDCESLPGTLFPCRCEETSAHLTMYSDKTTRSSLFPCVTGLY